MPKVAIIGAGNVGTMAAYCLAHSGLCDVVLVDVVEGMPQAKGIDLQHAAPALGLSLNISGSNDYAAIEGADIVLHTAGIPRKPGMDRMDLLKTNVAIARTAAQAVLRYAPQAIVIAVANPLDVIAMAFYRETGFPSQRVFGMAGTLDSTRFRYFIAAEVGVWPGDVLTMVLGGHGDTMVPLPRYTSVGGVPLSQILAPEAIERLVARTRTGGGEIVNYLKAGSAFYAPGASAAHMAEGIIRGVQSLEAVSVYLTGEYGYRDIFLGVPTILGAAGVERIIELELTDTERAALDTSAAHTREGVGLLDVSS